MESFDLFAAALGLILVLELGDKTQLATISLATRRPWPAVLAGAVTGLVAVTAIGAAVGGLLSTTLGGWLPALKIGGGLLFITFGVWSYLRPDEEEAPEEDPRGPFFAAFALNFVAELGDKTQLAVIVLAATSAAPVSVFAGASLGLAGIAVTSVLIGKALARVLRARWLRLASTALFVAAGIFLLVEAVLPD